MQTGDPSSQGSSSYTPKAVSGISGVVIAVAAGTDHTCAVTALGAFCWGYNEYGQVRRTRNVPNGIFHVMLTHCSSVMVRGFVAAMTVIIRRLRSQRQYSDFPAALLR